MQAKEEILDFVLDKGKCGLGFTVVDDEYGVYVHSVSDDGAAAGYLQQGDKLIFIKGIDVSSWKLFEIVNMLKRTGMGRIPISISRISLNPTNERSILESLPPPLDVTFAKPNRAAGIGQTFTVEFNSLKSNKLGLILAGGSISNDDLAPVIVDSIVPHLEADRNGRIRPTDVIVAINGQRLTGCTLENANELLTKAEESGYAVLVLQPLRSFDANLIESFPLQKSPSLNSYSFERIILVQKQRSKSLIVRCRLSNKTIAGLSNAVLVSFVEFGSDLWNAGLRPGQFVLVLNDFILQAMTPKLLVQVQHDLNALKRLDVMVLTSISHDKKKNQQTELAEYDTMDQQSAVVTVVVRRNRGKFGITLTDRLQQLPYIEGTFVEHVEENLIGLNVDKLQPTMSIQYINGKPCHSIPFKETLQLIQDAEDTLTIKVLPVLFPSNDHSKKRNNSITFTPSKFVDNFNHYSIPKRNTTPLFIESKEHMQNTIFSHASTNADILNENSQQPLDINVTAENNPIGDSQKTHDSRNASDVISHHSASMKYRNPPRREMVELHSKQTDVKEQNLSRVAMMRNDTGLHPHKNNFTDMSDIPDSETLTSQVEATTNASSFDTGLQYDELPPSEVLLIEINRDELGPGFGISGGHEYGGIFVGNVADKGPASGILELGDKILQANGFSLIGVTHQAAVRVLKEAKDNLQMIIARYTFGQTEHFYTTLTKGPMGLGISVAHRQFQPSREGIYIQAIAAGGPADIDRTLKCNDRIIAVNGKSVIGISQEVVIEEFRCSGPKVQLLVEREVKDGSRTSGGTSSTEVTVPLQKLMDDHGSELTSIDHTQDSGDSSVRRRQLLNEIL
eukprot:gene2760-5618_t